MQICYRLLDVIAGRKELRGLSGDVLVDGHKQPKKLQMYGRICCPGEAIFIAKYCVCSLKTFFFARCNIKIDLLFFVYHNYSK